MGLPDDERDAHAHAVALLARRPLSVAELRRALSERGHQPETVEPLLGRLAAAGALDDVALCRHWFLTRAERLGHGPRRLIEELERRGIAREAAEAAWEAALRDGDIDPAALLAAALAERLPASGALDRRTAARVYNALLRAGFEPDQVAGLLEDRCEDAARFSDPDEADDELP